MDTSAYPNSASERRALDGFSALIHRIYEAGTQPQRWTETVGAIAASVGADKGLLFTPSLAPQHGGLIFPYGITEETLQLWGSRYIDHDLWLDAIQEKGLAVEGSTWTDTRVMSDDRFLSSIFYREFLSHIDIRRVCGGVVLEQGPGLPLTAISVFRGERAPPFGEQERQWIERLLPHLSRSFGMTQRLDNVRVQLASSHAALDRLAFGVALLDEKAQVLHLNAAARKVVERGDGLKVDEQGLLSSSHPRRDGTSLERWLSAFVESKLLSNGHFSDGFAVARTADKAASRYFLQCTPVASLPDWSDYGDAVRFVVFITDPQAFVLPSLERLMDVYGLTPAQARTAREMAAGASYKAVARQLRTSEETVRSHIKQIYPKMRVNRQADLVRLVLSLGQVSV